MLFLEFSPDLGQSNLVKYRNTTDGEWYYLFMDMETLHLLLQNFAVISTMRLRTQSICCDNLTTSKTIRATYYGAEINLFCGPGCRGFDLADLEQNY